MFIRNSPECPLTSEREDHSRYFLLVLWKYFLTVLPNLLSNFGSEKGFCITLLKDSCVSYMFSNSKVFNMIDKASSGKMFQSYHGGWWTQEPILFIDEGVEWISKTLEYSQSLRSRAEGGVQPCLLRVSTPLALTCNADYSPCPTPSLWVSWHHPLVHQKQHRTCSSQYGLALVNTSKNQPECFGVRDWILRVLDKEVLIRKNLTWKAS